MNGREEEKKIDKKLFRMKMNGNGKGKYVNGQKTEKFEELDEFSY